MSDDIAVLESEVREYKLQLETVSLSLQNDPDNAELQGLAKELEEVITLSETTLAELKPPSAPAPATQPTPPPKEKWSKENHPAYQAGYRKPEVEEEPSHTPTAINVNDTVLARWKSGDGAFYSARVTGVTGSKSNPIYTVRFQKYNTTENLSAKDIKPLSFEARKRKADGISGSSTPTQLPANPNVISAAANVNPALAQQAKKEPSKVSDGPVRPAKIPRKVKANKELEAGKSKWQEFAAKSKTGKSGKKDSMFRTGEGVHARGKTFYLPRGWFKLMMSQWVLPAPDTRCAKTLQGQGIFMNTAIPMNSCLR